MDEMDEWEIECEECGIGVTLHSPEPPDFCPLCGRRAEAFIVSNEQIKKAFQYEE